MVRGVARSKYAKSAPRYEQHVNAAARESFDAPLPERNLSVQVHHFYTSGHRVDLDNLLKSILDGLKGAAYEDDSQIVRVSAERYNISDTINLDSPRDEWMGLLPPSRTSEGLCVDCDISSSLGKPSRTECKTHGNCTQICPPIDA